MAGITFRGSRNVIGVLTRSKNAVVATRTGSQCLRVIEKSYKAERVCSMAVFAQVACRQVIRRLAGRGNAVVTANAIRRDPGMVEPQYRLKRRRQVACVAVIACRWVIRWLAWCGTVVVAARALPVGFCVVHALQRQKTAGRVACDATFAGDDMARRFRCRCNGTAVAMTIATLSQSSLEDPLAVAITTGCDYVCAVEGETGRVVVEVRANRGLAKCIKWQDENSDKHVERQVSDSHGDTTSLNDHVV